MLKYQILHNSEARFIIATLGSILAFQFSQKSKVEIIIPIPVVF